MLSQNISEPVDFNPPRKRGIFLHLGVGLLLLAGVGGGMYYALGQEAGAYFLLFMVLAVVCMLPLPIIAYRGYALLQARYTLERDGLRIRWGLRTEDIPLNTIEWVRPATELGNTLHIPPFSVTGAILGKRENVDLGTVEFLASEIEEALVIVTREKAFVISPADERGFLRAFQRATELGSLNPIPQVSVVPAAFIRQVWTDKYARLLMLIGMGLTLAIFLVVTITIPNLTEISIGFTPQGEKLESGNPVQLLLLPVLAAMSYGIDLIVAFVFFRKEEQRPITYLLLGAGVLVPALMLLSVILLVF